MAPPLKHPGLDMFLKEARHQLDSLASEMSGYGNKIDKLQRVSGPVLQGQQAPNQSEWNYTMADLLISHVVFIGYMRQTLDVVLKAFDEIADELPKR